MGKKRTHASDEPRPAKIRKPTAADLEAEQSPPEFIIDEAKGLRRVVPYWFTHRTMAKGRWWGRKVLEVFQKEFQDQSPDYYKRAIEAGKISVNHEQKSIDYVLRNGDLVSHSTHRHEPPVSNANISIVFQDDDLLVIDKPPGIPVHPSGRYNHNTVLGILKAPEYGFKNLFSVNRIDRLTSGILLVALRKDKAAELAAQLADRTVEKTYLSRVKGRFPSEPINCAEPILVLSNKLGVNTVSPEGRPCETNFTLLKYNPETDTSVVVCEPKTGRTHQIRVHLQFLGYPIANDPIYCNTDLWGPDLGKGGVKDPQQVMEKIKNAKFLSDLGDGVVDLPSVVPAVEKVTAQQISDASEETIGSKTAATADILNINETTLDSGSSSQPADAHPADAFPCAECAITRPDPLPSHLRIFLHSWKYSGQGWAYETKMPDWAEETFSEKQ
ncbi:RNA pseudouridylate synthase domain containing protein 2 [Chytriomyces hyalinus]|nr:RNA pseudouridylate synthase domain containing protein 2 [Chytriomyces hyalinus]